MITRWNKAPADLHLSNEYVDVWRTRLDLSSNDVNSYLATLSEDERARANRFKARGKRKEFIITRGLLRKTLGQTLDIDPSSFEFDYAEHDKPFLSVASLGVPISFNVSHSHKQALVALTLDRAIGIDIEKVRLEVSFNKLAVRFFSKHESQALGKLDKDILPKAFFACWTRKEAFVKALGDGISFGLSEFSVSVDPDETNVSLLTHWDPDESSNWSIVNINADEDYIGALAIDGGKFKLRCWG